jgi:carboxyl-terminal processing protease
MITELAQKMKKQSDMTNRSLKLETFLAESKNSKADAKKYDDLEKSAPNLDIASLKVDLDRLGADTTKQNIAATFVKNLKKDIYLTEATSIIKDQLTGDGKLTGK